MDIGEPPALQLAERLLNDSNEEIQTLVAQRLQALHHERMQPLYQLLDYSNEDYYPTDRYVRHGAVEALCKTILAN